MRAIGLDVSTKATGLVILDANGKTPTLILEEVLSYDKLVGINKYKTIAGAIMERIHHYNPQSIAIEGYSLNMKNASSVVPLVELGGIIRLMFNLDGLEWLDPRAGELKKFVSGNGNAKKNTMMMHVLDRWGHKSKTDDTADGYGLACMGLAHMGKLEGMTAVMRSIIGQVKIRSN